MDSTNTIGSLLDSFITMVQDRGGIDSIWREEPVDLLTFFTSPDFLNETPYEGKQTEFLQAVNDIVMWKMSGSKECPENLRQVTEIVGMFGKGSGKDFLISGVLAWMAYLLCCLANPQKYFGFASDEPIDLINVAMNAYQANNVFFKKLKARLTNCKWFRKVNYNPTEKEGAAHNEFQITKNQIRFYRNITAHSAHSEADSFEGFNPLVAIFDEIGGFEMDAAENAYQTLKSSATSRYGSKSLMIFISFPRHTQDFIMQKYAEATVDKDPEVYAMKGASWEVNKRIKKEDFAKEYARDPEGARMRLECEPPEYYAGLFQFPEKVDEVIEVGKHSQCPNLVVAQKITTRTLASGEQRHFLGLELYNLELNPAYTYYLGGDCGVENDSYVISLFHAEPTLITTVEDGVEVTKWFNKPVEDLLLEWRPSKKDRLPVDLMNVADVLEQICRQVHVKKAIFDKFNSAEVVQRLMSYGVDAEDKNWSNPFQLQIYTNLRGLIYTDQISLLDHVSDDPERLNANEQLKHLRLINGSKIDHDPDKGKDFSDARAGAVWLCTMDEAESTTHFAMPVLLGTKRRG